MENNCQPEEVRDSKTVVFLGPTLDYKNAYELLPAQYRKPAQMGSVYALIASGVNRIILIDGLFGGVPSIWQRELLKAIDVGIEVIGCSSMGALRAAELHQFGMYGYGEIYQDYIDGKISNDDEVVLVHEAEYPFRPITLPLVNIRYGLKLAEQAGTITTDEKQKLLSTAVAITYDKRTIESWLDAASETLNRQTISNIKAFWVTTKPDLKAEDAKATLLHIAQGERPFSLKKIFDQQKSEKLATLDQWKDIGLYMRFSCDKYSDDLTNIAAQWERTSQRLKNYATEVAAQLWILEQARIWSPEWEPPTEEWIKAYRAGWLSREQNDDINTRAHCKTFGLEIVEFEYEIERRAYAHWLVLAKHNNTFAKRTSEPLEEWAEASSTNFSTNWSWCLAPLAIAGAKDLSVKELIKGIVLFAYKTSFELGLYDLPLDGKTAVDWQKFRDEIPTLPERLGHHGWDSDAEAIRVLQVEGLLGQ